MSIPLILTLDIGTSSTRALLYDPWGRCQPGAEVQIPYAQSLTADGGVQTDPDVLVERTVRAIRKVLAISGKDMIKRIAGVATSCFWHSLVGIDGDGNAITPLYSWADTRSGQQAERFKQQHKPAVYHQRTGAFFHSSYWPAKIAWINETQPELSSKVVRWVGFGEYLYGKLIGDWTASVSMASGTGLFDQNACGWDAKSIALVPALHVDQLPSFGDDKLAHSTAKAFRNLPSVPWVRAYGDGAASNVGAGGVSDRVVVVNLGTSGAIRCVAERSTIEPPHGLFAYRADKKRFVVGGAVSNGGNVYAWLTRHLALAHDPQRIERQMLRLKPDSHGLTVLPLWAGERSPGFHSDARATISGMNLSTSAEHILLAGLESVAYPFSDLRDELQSIFGDPGEFVVSGGGFTKSALTSQIFADVLGHEIRLCTESEPSGRGAAILAAEALGLSKGIESAKRPVGKSVKPRPENIAVYRDAIKRYRALYAKMLDER